MANARKGIFSTKGIDFRQRGQLLKQTAAAARERWRPIVGDGVDTWSDAEFIDNIDYTLFPNFHPWGAYNRIVYRFRPYGNRHDMSIMECMFLSPYDESQPKPPAAPIICTSWPPT